MAPWLEGLLLGVFAVHLALFARLWWRRREAYYLAVCVTFALLVATFALRLLAPEWALAGHRPAAGLRVAAWGAAAVSLSWLVLRRLRRRPRRSR